MFLKFSSIYNLINNHNDSMLNIQCKNNIYFFCPYASSIPKVWTAPCINARPIPGNRTAPCIYARPIPGNRTAPCINARPIPGNRTAPCINARPIPGNRTAPCHQARPIPGNRTAPCPYFCGESLLCFISGTLYIKSMYSTEHLRPLFY